MVRSLERVLSLLLGLAGIVMAGVVVRREVLASNAPAAASGREPPRWIDTWQAIAANGTLIGGPGAPVVVTEFADLECPFCKLFHDGPLSVASRRYGSRVAVRFIHFPIQAHRFASTAARAAECAGAIGRFGDFVDAVYAKQDSLGLKSWASYGRDAGVPDTLGFEQCSRGNIPLRRIDDQRAAGERLGIRGTPTIMVNGWLFSAPPAESTFIRAIGDLLNGRAPFPR